jgi:tetratricopeptide (TPR) repeat protein
MGLDASAAARHYSRALELGNQDQGSRLPLLLRWAEALVQEGSYAEAVLAFREAVLDLRDVGRVREAAVTLTRLSEIRYAIGEAGVMDPLREALALLQDDEPSAEMATVLARWGKALWFSGEPRAGLEAVERALSLTSELGLPEPAAVLGWRGGIRCTLGDHGGFDDYRRAIRAAEQQGLERERAIICFNCSDALLAEQGPAAAAATLEDGIEWARRRLRERMGVDALPTEHQSLGPAWDAESVRPLTVNLIETLGLMGRWEEALAKATELAPQLERGRAGVALLIVRVQQAVLSGYRGDAEGAAAITEWLEARARTSDVPWMKAYAALSSAPVRLRLGERAAGLDTLSQWVALPPPGSGPNYALYIPEAVRAAIGAGDPELARKLAAGLRPVLPVHQQVLATTQALLAEQLGEHEQAVAGFMDAAARWQAFGVPYEEGQALLGMGRCLTALGRAPEAAAPLIGARSVFGRLGARPAFAEADRRLAGLRRD